MNKNHADENMDFWLNELTNCCATDSNWFEGHGRLAKRYPPYKMAYNKAKTKEQLFQVLFESTDEAVFIMKEDEFIDCNQRTLELFKCTRDQIVGETPYRFSPREQLDGRPSELLAKEKIYTALSGKPLRFGWLHMRFNGELFKAEVRLSRFDIRGELYLVATVREISESMLLPRPLLENDFSHPLLPRMDENNVLKTIEYLKDAKLFADPNRLVIMFLLYYNVSMNFTDLQEKLELTPGNLGHHLKKLEEAGFVRTQKIISWRVLTTVTITDEGASTFSDFASRMKSILYPIH